MQRFWVSWVQRTEDYRPVNYPPNRRILGWWCSGSDSDENAVLCAVVEANNESEVRDAVYTDWPELAENPDWRFMEEKSDTFVPNDRFPISGWMTSRFDRKKKI